MPPKKYAIKGEPDFTKFSDEKIAESFDLISALCLAYHRFDPDREIYPTLQKVWKHLSSEKLDRDNAKPYELPEYSPPTPKPLMWGAKVNNQHKILTPPKLKKIKPVNIDR